MHLGHPRYQPRNRAPHSLMRVLFTLWFCLVPVFSALHYLGVAHEAPDECLEPAPGAADDAGAAATGLALTGPAATGPALTALTAPGRIAGVALAAPVDPAPGSHSSCPLAWRLAPQSAGPDPVASGPRELVFAPLRTLRDATESHRAIPLLQLAPKTSPPTA